MRTSGCSAAVFLSVALGGCGESCSTPIDGFPPVPPGPLWEIESPGPYPRNGEVLEHLPGSRNFFLFGGAANDSWVLNEDTQRWLAVTGDLAPPPGTSVRAVSAFGGICILAQVEQETQVWTWGAQRGRWEHLFTDSLGVLELSMVASISGDVVALGGVDSRTGGPLTLNQIFRIAGEDPTHFEVSQTAGPTPEIRTMASFVELRRAGGILLFGGRQVRDHSPLNDVWLLAFDPRPTWRKLDTVLPWSDPTDIRAFSDEATGEVIVLGGAEPGLWSISWNGALVVRPVAAGAHLSARDRESVGYSSTSRSLFGFGGVDAQVYTSGTRRLTLADPSRWVEKPGPSRQQWWPVIPPPQFFPSNGHFVGIGLKTFEPRIPALITIAGLNEETIDVRMPDRLGPIRSDFATALDLAGQRAILAFGKNEVGEPVNDVWTTDIESGSGRWGELLVQGERPPARSLAGSAWDPGLRRLVIFGGMGRDGPLGDTWVLSLASQARWERIVTQGRAPSARAAAAAIVVSGQIVVHGGFVETDGAAMGDTWLLALDPPGEWTLVNNDGPLAARHVLGASSLTGAMFIFGADTTEQDGLGVFWRCPNSTLPWKSVSSLGLRPASLSGAVVLAKQDSFAVASSLGFGTTFLRLNPGAVGLCPP